jgi:6-phosphogluconolactonase
MTAVADTNALAQRVRWHPTLDEAAFRETATRWILNASDRAIAACGVFSIVLSGGNTPREIYAMLRAAKTDWSRWQVWFGDERCLPPDDPQRNSAMARAVWLDHVPIPAAQVHAIPAELGPYEAAHRYADALRDAGEFDLVLLGLGEDGHTASLFPGHDWGESENAAAVLAVLAAPKPPPEPVRLSAERLARAREVLFLANAKSKRAAFMRWREG